MLMMLRHLSARGSLFLFVRSHHQLEYYFRVEDLHCAANQSGVRHLNDSPRVGNVVELRPNGYRQASQDSR
jgi:hypothetical protein